MLIHLQKKKNCVEIALFYCLYYWGFFLNAEDEMNRIRRFRMSTACRRHSKDTNIPTALALFSMTIQPNYCFYSDTVTKNYC